MCTTFLTAMMLLIVAKRLKAAQNSQMYGNDVSVPGLPPVAMLLIFIGVMTILVIMAKLNFFNQTLVFAVVTCLLLFTYMLKLTLFASRWPVLLR
jgi:UDP-N-acetylmuramyl pentapeptide phosphotransferase/UDP-N-acetylglucosamine-1-phosphate transferase